MWRVFLPCFFVGALSAQALNAQGIDLLKITSDDELIDPLPQLGTLDDVRLLLWTRSNPGDAEYYELLPDNVTNLSESPFDSALPTYFVVHGFTGNAEQSWILQTKTAFLNYHSCNVISVDWRTLVISPWYNVAVENAYKVGNFSASYIDWLCAEVGLQPSQIHIIGHSLGAQTAGLTGQYVTAGQIDRVTGLDPAGPLWYEKDPEFRLDKSDAAFVDIIHTNSGSIPEGCIAMFKDMGHVDFYPNGGQHQPGCDENPGNIVHDWLDLFGGCSHDRAEYLWIESIAAQTPEQMFTAWPCENWETFSNGSCPDCGQGCLHMGFHVERRLSGLYFLSTKAESPYALGNNQS